MKSSTRLALLSASLLLMAAASPPRPRDGAAPDGEFLEYLGTFESSTGESIDPLTMEELSPTGEQPRPRSTPKPAKQRRDNEKKDDSDEKM
jgi:hypothetical protein